MKTLESAYNLPESGFVRLNDILKLIPIGRSTWWAKVQSGKYPQPVKLGPHTTAWKVDAIRELIEQLGESNEEADTSEDLEKGANTWKTQE